MNKIPNASQNELQKTLLSLIFFSLLFFCGWGFAKPSFCTPKFKKTINYDLIYKETPILDFMYEEGLDPEQDGDYEKYIISPYTLIRITDTLRSKNTILKQGYYLVKPKNKDGYEFLLFKQNGRIAGIVPVYQKVRINPLLVYKEPPKSKSPPYKAIPKKIFIETPKKILSWPFRKWYNKRRVPLPPKSALDSKVVGNGRYLEIWLYIDSFLYKALLKIE